MLFELKHYFSFTVSVRPKDQGKQEQSHTLRMFVLSVKYFILLFISIFSNKRQYCLFYILEGSCALIFFFFFVKYLTTIFMNIFISTVLFVFIYFFLDVKLPPGTCWDMFKHSDLKFATFSSKLFLIKYYI